MYPGVVGASRGLCASGGDHAPCNRGLRAPHRPAKEPAPSSRWSGGSASAAELGAATRGQLVVGAVRLRTARALAGQLGERALNLAPHAADRDAEHALAALQQVDDLVVGHAL